MPLGVQAMPTTSPASLMAVAIPQSAPKVPRSLRTPLAPEKRVPAPISRQSHAADHLASVVETSRPN